MQICIDSTCTKSQAFNYVGVYIKDLSTTAPIWTNEWFFFLKTTHIQSQRWQALRNLFGWIFRVIFSRSPLPFTWNDLSMCHEDMESPLMTPANESQQQGALEKALEEDWHGRMRLIGGPTGIGCRPMSQDPAELPEADPEAAKVRQTARIWYIYIVSICIITIICRYLCHRFSRFQTVW